MTRTEAANPQFGRIPAAPTVHRWVTIDALRGIAAISVVLFHAARFSPFVGTSETPEWLGRALAWILTYGLGRVDLFFVLSGLCIHLKWARDRSRGVSTRLDPRTFFKRRFMRLYPAYLASLCVFITALVIEGRFRLTPFQWYDLGLHLALVHNLDPRTSYSINNVLWTLGVEAQLYAAYALFVTLRERLGWARLLLLCLSARIGWFALSFGAHRLFHVQIPATEAAAAHWFTWALGAWIVEGLYGVIKLPRWTLDLRLGAGLLAAAAIFTYLDRSANPHGWFHRCVWLSLGPLWGLGFMVWTHWLVRVELRSGRSFGERKWIKLFAGLGTISYSLYLTHEFVLQHLAIPLKSFCGVPADAETVFAVFVLVPVSLPFAWGFFQLFERPFLRTRPDRIQAEAA